MKEDGEEYSNYISDIIEEHKSKTIKSVAAFILQNMSNKYDGFGNHIITYCTQLVDFGIQGGNMSNIQQYPYLTAEDRIFTLSSVEYQIEASLLLFSILANHILKYDILEKSLKDLITVNFNTLLSANSEIIKDRLCLFLGNYLDILFEPDDERFSACIDFLFMNLFLYKDNQGIAHKVRVILFNSFRLLML